MKGNENRISGWYQRWELNPRPPLYEGGALNQLSYSGIKAVRLVQGSHQAPVLGCTMEVLATPRGLEPLTSGVTGRRSNQLNYEAI